MYKFLLYKHLILFCPRWFNGLCSGFVIGRLQVQIQVGMVRLMGFIYLLDLLEI